MPASASASAAGVAAGAAGAAAAGMAAAGMADQASQRAGAGAGRGGGGEAGPVWRSADVPRTGSSIHTLVTSNGSPYLNFQLRIMCAARLASSPSWLWLGAHAATLPWALSSCNASAAARWRTTHAMRAAAKRLPDRARRQQRRPPAAAGRDEL
jgi:opacity protein-like surface antigen